MSQSKITLISSDELEFQVDQEVAEKSITLKNLIEALKEDDTLEKFEIPLPNIKGKYLKKILQWCEQHRDTIHAEPDACDQSDGNRNVVLDPWDTEYFQVPPNALYHIIDGANFLDISYLKLQGCKLSASFVQGKTSERLKKIFSMKVEADADEDD
ncbi:Skp1 family, tetramerization domain-containing protein [Scheffersomyces coipomensis]|uniref:Skp1 family, tetramerization domain-containing protein n=1 Tax=Scheffersomyces coipomensis TaxID=1788519 RepID=UPI00315D94B5